MKKPPVAETTGVLLCTSPGTHPIKLLAVPKPPSAMIFKATAAFGDEADSLPRPACVQISTFLAGCGHSYTTGLLIVPSISAPTPAMLAPYGPVIARAGTDAIGGRSPNSPVLSP